MGRLRTTLTVFVALNGWGIATEGAAPGDAAPSSSARPAAPVPPIKYLEAGAKLFNSGNFEKAASYLKAAKLYEDQLLDDEKSTLNAYLTELAKVQSSGGGKIATAPAARNLGSTRPADTKPTAIASAPRGTLDSATARASMPTADPKQEARWALQEARYQIRQGDYDLAEKKVAEAEQHDIRWGLFDDTPAKVRADIAKARPKALATASAKTDAVKDRAAAKKKLNEARVALEKNQYEVAEAIALDVKSWGLNFGLFEDTPDKVANAARALRRRDSMRDRTSKDLGSQGVYDILVQQSRELMKAGKLEEAESKARQAQRMTVVPSLTADRAESVLYDIDVARKQSKTATVAAKQELPQSLRLEREGDALLDKGDQVAAAAKFTESARAKELEASALTAAPAPVDPAVQRTQAVVETSGPDLSAPADAKVAKLDDAPAELKDAIEPAKDVTPELTQAPADKPQVAPMTRGDMLLSEAKALYTSGNYGAAKQKAHEAKDSKSGVEAKADDLLSQIALAEQGGALSMYESALAAIRKGENARARTLLTEVSTSGASLDESLRTKIDDLLMKLGSNEKGKAVVGEKIAVVSDADALAAQKLNAEVGTKIAEGRRLQEVDPDKAIAIYEQTLKAVKASGLSPNLQRPMEHRLEIVLDMAKKDKVAFDVKMQDKKERAEIELKRLRILEADKAKKARVKEFLDKAQDAYSKGDFYASEQAAKRAQEIDPEEVTATILVFKSKMERRIKTNNDIRDAKEDGVVVAWQEVDKASILDPEVQVNSIAYARNWKDLSNERLRTNKRLEYKKPPKVLFVESKLNEPITVNFQKQPLSEALTFISSYTGLNIALDDKALVEEGLTSASEVTLKLNNVSLKTVLKLMLRPLGLNYITEEDVLLVTSPQATQAETFPRTYPVGDLILVPQNHGGADASVKTAADMLKQNDGNAQQAMANGNLPGLGGQTPNASPSGPTVSVGGRQEIDMMPLIQLISSSIAPGSWKIFNDQGQDVSSAYGLGGGFGGGGGDGINDSRPPGSITPFLLSISLIIRHTAEVHEQVADLLRQLRRLQDLQVSIEVRFITVNDNFFEQIGVDFDFQIQSDVFGKHSTLAVPNLTLFSTSGTTSGTTGGTTSGTTGGTTGGGTTGGGTTGGAGGGAGGLSGNSGVGGGGGAGGGLSGGAGGGAGGVSGGTTGGVGGGSSSVSPAFIVNPVRDHALGPGSTVVGTQAGGIGNFTQNLAIPFTNTNSTLIAPSNAVPGAGGSLGVAFLSDLEVYFFLTAAQGDTRSNVLQAPKITTFNGAQAFIYDGQTQYYIASLIPIIGPGSVAFQPVPVPFQSGVFLSVTPVVSADRRYVRLSLSPFFNALNGFQTIQVPAAVGGSGLGGGGATINATLQLPNFEQTTINTTVTVPDGGTVLLGGVKRLNEQRLEYGVPILSKTPWIDRLFRNVGIGRTTTSLMLMVTPRIIILEEEEERLGIPSTAM